MPISPSCASRTPAPAWREAGRLQRQRRHDAERIVHLEQVDVAGVSRASAYAFWLESVDRVQDQRIAAVVDGQAVGRDGRSQDARLGPGCG